MALQDILDAISAEADRQIAEARSAHQKELARIREDSQRAITQKRQTIAMQKEKKLEQMRRKAESHAETAFRNAQLRTKRELLNRLYEEVIAALAQTPEEQMESLLRSLLRRITVKGELRPTQVHAALLKRLAPSEQFTMGPVIDGAGGFVFISPTQEHDCRLETLVQHVLRPQSELHAAQRLFGPSPSST